MRWLKTSVEAFRRERRGGGEPTSAVVLTLHALWRRPLTLDEGCYLAVMRAMAGQDPAHEALKGVGKVTVLIPGTVATARHFGRSLVLCSAKAPWARELYGQSRGLRRDPFQSPPDFVEWIAGVGPHLAGQCGRDWPLGMAYDVLGTHEATREIPGPGCFFHPGDGIFPAAVMTLSALRAGMAVRIPPLEGCL